MSRVKESLKCTAILCIAAGISSVGILKVIYQCDKELDRKIFQSKKFYSMFKVMNRWMEAKQSGKSMEKWFIKNKYNTIAIYGMHYIGERLVQELKDSRVTVLYAIDKNISSSNTDLMVLKPDQELPKVDAVIITSVIYFYAMCRNIYKKVECPIISIEEVVEGMC